MKAAVIDQFGSVPQIREFPDPVCAPGETLVQVRAAALENFDRMTAAGTHYASEKTFPRFPAVAGSGGVGVTEDGRNVFFRGVRPPYGSFGERAVARFVLPVPDGLDPVMAAALPGPVLTSLVPLKYSAGLQAGETVLVNGATGVTGRIAVQVARSLGAARVVGTGRNPASLEALRDLGCDQVIDLTVSDQALRDAFRDGAGERGYDVILDFLWGRPAEVLIASMIPGEAEFPDRRIRYVQMGEAAGAKVSVPASALRTSGLVLQGVGPVSREIFSREMSGVWDGIRSGSFRMEVERVSLADVTPAWERGAAAGKRLVIVP